MNTNKKTTTILEDVKVNVKIKLSGLWVANLFLFIYVDYFGLFIPGVMEKIIEGEVAHTGIQVTQVFLLVVQYLRQLGGINATDMSDIGEDSFNKKRLRPVRK